MKLVSVPANPVPADGVVGVLKTPDGVALRFARWPPPAGRKGTVCLFQGRAEFIEKYFEVVRDLHARGFAVAALDWHGQGLSQRLTRDPHKGHVRRFADYVTDLETLLKEVVLPDCPPPFLALGQGMGATVLIESASRGHRWFDRTVLSAPMISLAQRSLWGAGPAIARVLQLAGLGRLYVPGGGAAPIASTPFADNVMTSDPVRYARTGAILEAEPALGVGAPTIGWVSAAFRTMTALQQPSYSARLRQPMLLIAAGHDQLVSLPAIEDFAWNLRAGSHLFVPGAMHDLLFEQDQYRRLFWAAFDAFVPGTPLYG
ncbi:MAG: serine aminopeptidase domain-containing protein [Rhodoplanes sp.]